MPILQIQLTKQAGDPWILSMDHPPSTEYFTQEQIDTLLLPYISEIRAIPGLLDITETVDGNVKTVQYEFDTLENMAASKEVMVNSDLARARATVIHDAMVSHGIAPYTIQRSIL